MNDKDFKNLRDELMQREVQCSKKYFKFFLTQEAFGNNIEKELQKLRPKCILNIYETFTDNICSACNASRSFLQKCINFVEELLKLSPFEGSIIP